MLTVLSSPLQVRSLTSARGKGASGVLHGATSSRGITESTRVQSPLNATIVTGNAAPKVVFKKPVDFCDCPRDKRPGSQQRSPFCPTAWSLYHAGTLCLAPVLSAWVARQAGRWGVLPKQSKLFPSYSTEQNVGPCVGLTETCWCLLWAQDSVHRAALVNTLISEKTSRGPQTISVMDLSTKHLPSFLSPDLVNLLCSQRQSSLYLLCFKDYPKHHWWLAEFWQGGPHKNIGVW